MEKESLGWSDHPAKILRDLIVNSGFQVNEELIEEATKLCDELVPQEENVK